MKTRLTPRVIPDSNLYLAIKLDREDAPVHHLRVPSPMAGAKAAKGLPPDLLQHLQQVGNMAGVRAMAMEAGAPALSLAGYIVALAWHNETLDMESTPLPKEGTLEFGERAYEELYEAGYSLDEILQMAIIVGGEWLTRNGKAAEAIQRADFFGLTKGVKNSSPSTSESISSETLGDSNN